MNQNHITLSFELTANRVKIAKLVDANGFEAKEKVKEKG